MDLKVYHGTSNFFLPSIRDKGLGGLNPNYEYKFLDLLRYIYTLAELYLLDDDSYLKIRATTEAMAKQQPLIREVNGVIERHNFKHSKIYVSSVEYRAVIYSVTTGFGSEILSRIIDIYKLLKKKKGSIVIPKAIDFFGIDIIYRNQYSPILIEIDGLTSDDLNTEFGESSVDLLNEISRLRSVLNDVEFYTAIQYYNFELKRPILPCRLNFYKVYYIGSPFYSGFKYDLEKIN